MEENCPLQTSCEPMDVDLSTNSNNVSFKDREKECFSPCLSTDIPSKNEVEPEVWNIKKYHIVRSKGSPKHCSNTTLAVELKTKLYNRVYGQSEVIDEFVKSWENDVDSKILFLYGGTGVGKTFTISLALENFWNSSNVYHYTMPSFVDTFSTDTMFGLNLCESSIVVVDDLKQGDFHIKKQVEEIIKKSKNVNKKITVILVFNCDVVTKGFVKRCDETFYLELKNEFNHIKVYKSFIEFKPLTQDTLKLCIEDELRGRVVSNIDLENILNNFNVALDGCKGVHNKIKFLNMLR